MTTHVHILMGGLYSFDGYATSRGMLGLESRIQAECKDVKTYHYLWADYLRAYSVIIATPKEEKIVVVGYSGGGKCIQWLAIGYDYRVGKVTLRPPKIDLAIGYDPSPAWGWVSDQHGVMPLPATVKDALCYWNKQPLMLGLGGGLLPGKQVRIKEIALQHLAVQYSKALHDQTIKEINLLR